MAKKIKNRIAEMPTESEPSIFVDIKIKDLPKDTQARHMKRIKRLKEMSDERQKINEAGEKDIKDLVKQIKGARDAKEEV